MVRSTASVLAALLLAACAHDGAAPSSAEPSVSVTVEIHPPELTGRRPVHREVVLPPGSTALDAAKTAEPELFQAHRHVHGRSYLHQLMDLRRNGPDKPGGWTWTLNGAYPERRPADVPVGDGDRVVFVHGAYQ